MPNWFDITVLIALAIALVLGMRQGLAMQLSGLASIVIAAIFGGKIASRILPHLTAAFDMPPPVAVILSYVAAFALIVVALWFVGKALHNLLKAAQLSAVNRMAGGLIALATAMVMLSLLLNMALFLDPEENVITEKIKTESFFYERVQVVVPAFVPYLNKEVWQQYIPGKRDEKPPTISI